MGELAAEKEAHAAEKEAHAEQLANVNKTAFEAKREVKDLYEKLEQSGQAKQAMDENLQRQCDELRRQSSSSQDQLASSQRRVKSLQEEIASQRTKMETAEADARQLRREVTDLRKTVAQSSAAKADNDELLEQIAKVRASNDDLCQRLATAQEGQRDNHMLSAECARLHEQQESVQGLRALVQNQLTAVHEKESQTQKQLKQYQAILTASKRALEAVMRGVNESEIDEKNAEERCLTEENVTILREKLANAIETETQVCSHLGEQLGRAVTTEMEVHCRYQEAMSELQELRENGIMRSASKESLGELAGPTNAELMATCQRLRDDLAKERDNGIDAWKNAAGEHHQNQELREDLRLTRAKLEETEKNDRQWQAECQRMHEEMRRESNNKDSIDIETEQRDLALQRRNEQRREELAQSLSQTRDLNRVLKELSSARASESEAQELVADCRRQSLTLQRKCDQMRDQLVGMFREDGRSF